LQACERQSFKWQDEGYVDVVAVLGAELLVPGEIGKPFVDEPLPRRGPRTGVGLPTVTPAGPADTDQIVSLLDLVVRNQRFVAGTGNRAVPAEDRHSCSPARSGDGQFSVDERALRARFGRVFLPPVAGQEAAVGDIVEEFDRARGRGARRSRLPL